jgi:hypothetical protein
LYSTVYLSPLVVLLLLLLLATERWMPQNDVVAVNVGATMIGIVKTR